jgi:hypothetical protein
MQKAINNATAQITGAKGGVIQTHFNADGEPYEMTIANNKNLASATKLWRWNIGGLGFSNTGYDGQYRTAITQDGSIVADFITTGTLDASKATITNLDASNINTGTIKNKSNNNSYWNLETGDFKTTNATIVNSTVTGSFYAESGGTWVELKNGELHGSETGYVEIGKITFNKVINSGSDHYDAMSIEAYKDLYIQGHLWADPDGGGAHRVLDDAYIEIVNWIKWKTQRSSGIEWVREGTEMACGEATFHCGMLCHWTQFENVVVGD